MVKHLGLVMIALVGLVIVAGALAYGFPLSSGHRVFASRHTSCTTAKYAVSLASMDRMGTRCTCPDGLAWEPQTKTCTIRQFACPMYYLPWCGCDGKVYGNSCMGHAAGVKYGHTCSHRNGYASL